MSANCSLVRTVPAIWRPSRVKICKSDAIIESFTDALIVPLPIDSFGTKASESSKSPRDVVKVSAPFAPL
ncbi:MAG: hypothetical protein VYE61_05825, partial [Pseudomonadota bacterium]|nr:hypothetical protein [Pseudomonadota bacterium]